jgi:hypothetical protein
MQLAMACSPIRQGLGSVEDIGPRRASGEREVTLGTDLQQMGIPDSDWPLRSPQD